MLKNRLFELFMCACLFWAVPAFAGEPDYQALLAYLNDTFAEQQQVVGKISTVRQNQMLVPKDSVSLKKGRELLILQNQPETPDALLPVIGVLKIDRLTGDGYVARQIAAFEEVHPESGDPIARPASPVIHLYSGIDEKGGSAPYQKLLNKLLENHYEVLEINSMEDISSSRPYGILLRLENTGTRRIVKVQSLYSGATLYAAGRDDTPGFQTAHTETETGTAFQLLRLSDKFQRLVICQLDTTPEMEFVLLSDDSIQVFHKSKTGLKSVYDYAFEASGGIGIHLHAMDLTGDGRDELAVTLGRRKMAVDAWTTRLCSQILSVQDNRLQPLKKDISYYLRVISDPRGNPVLIGQAKGEYEPFAGDILKIDLAADGSLSAAIYEPAQGVHSVYQFNLLPGYTEHIMILEPSSHISVYRAETEKLLANTDQNYGSYETVSYPITLEKPEFRGGFDKKTSADCFAPRRFSLKPAYDDQVFTINKQRETDWNLKKLKNLISSEKARDSLAAVKWTGQAIRQTYESKSMAKDILDFSFMHGKGKDGIFVLVKDAQGFALLRME